MFHHDCRYNIRFIFKITNSDIFRIPKNQSISNISSRYFHVSFTIEGLSNMNCLQKRVGKPDGFYVLKVNNKDTRMTPGIILVSLLLTLTIFTPSFSVSIVNIEHLNANWEKPVSCSIVNFF